MKFNLTLHFVKTENEKIVYQTIEQYTFFYINHTGYYTIELTKKFNKYPKLNPADIETCIEFEDYREQNIELSERNKDNKKYFIYYRITPV